MYPDDILSSGRVSALEPLEELWYRRAIDLGWKNGGMPADPDEFAGWVGRGCTADAAAKIIKKLYVPHKKDATKVVNERQEIERKKFLKKRKQKSDAGKQGMANRWKQKGKDDNSVITEDNIPIPISIPISTTSYEVEKKEEPPTASPDPKPNKKVILPLDWRPSIDLLAWTRDFAPGLDVADTLDDFLDFWRDIATRDNKRTLRGWDATWKKRIKAIKEKQNGSTQRLPAADRNWERTVANEQLGEDLRSGKLDQLLDELHRRDPLYRHEILPPGEPPAALTGSVDDYGEGLDRFS